MKFVKNLALIVAGIFALSPAFAQNWMPTSAPDFFWRAIASSADGSKLAAVEGGDLMGPICTSADSGATWITNDAPDLYWSSIASSADGTKLVAVTYGDGIYTSTNSGAEWVTNDVPMTTWDGVASSADGTKLAAVIDGSGIYLSTNSGASWNPSLAPDASWKSIASSADGTKLAAASYDAGIYLSADSGNTWIQTTNVPSGVCIVSSADGDTLAMTTDFETYISTNSGMTWTQTSSTGFISAAISADGTKLVAAASGGGIYTSTNSGFNWIASDAPMGSGVDWNWQRVASSADGEKLAAIYESGLYNGGIWTAQTVPSPNLNISPSGSTIKLSWIIPSTGFVLQQSSSLVSGDWTTVTNVPGLNLTNLQEEVILSPAGDSLFYRLKTP